MNNNMNKIPDVNRKSKTTDNKDQKGRERDPFLNKKDVDEFDISKEYFSNSKAEADGEDF